MTEELVPRGDRTPQDIPDITLAEFLRARLDEDERAARAATPGRWELDELEDVSDLFGQLVAGNGTRRVANVGNRASRDEGGLLTFDARHIARHDPARVLADVEAKRQIIAGYEHARDNNPYGEMRDYGFEEGLGAALHLLALPYAEHPDYRAEWAP